MNIASLKKHCQDLVDMDVPGITVKVPPEELLAMIAVIEAAELVSDVLDEGELSNPFERPLTALLSSKIAEGSRVVYAGCTRGREHRNLKYWLYAIGIITLVLSADFISESVVGVLSKLF